MAPVPNLAAMLAGPGSAAYAMAATVATAPSGPDGLIDVTWTVPADDDIGEESFTERGVKWVCRDGSTPAVDDAVALVLDSHGDPWAMVWGTG